jgi:predicted nicotinamide N-methyase
MEVLKNHGLSSGLNVMEVGCGWGLAGIYCAKNHVANVTCVDIDSEVFPYLSLHSDLNRVQVSTLCMGFDEIESRQLAGIDVLIGADICFWDEMADSLQALIIRALAAGVRLVVIADPGRVTFEVLETYFVAHHRGQASSRSVRRPFPVCGRVLVVGSLCRGQDWAPDPKTLSNVLG